MKFESFIARRYLVSKHKINFITIISVISIAGISIGVAALIVVLTVFNGFGSLVSSFLMNLDPDIRIEATSFDSEKKIEDVSSELEKIKEVKQFAPFVEGKILGYNKGITQVFSLKGIDYSKANVIYNLSSNVIYGKLNSKKLDGLIIGLPLADKMQVITGDTITVISPVGIENVITRFSMPKTQKFVVTGIFSSNNNDYDDSYAFTNLETAAPLLGYKNTFQGYDIKLSDIDQSSKVKTTLQKKFDESDFSVNTWYDFHQELYSVMQIERWTAYLILSLIIAVATFNILGSLSMSVIEKKRDIGILNAMGVTEKSVIRIFMFEGLLIGILGTLIGVVIGYFVCWLQINYNIYPLNPAQYKVDALPMQIRISDFFFISGISMLLAFLASLYPAKKAAKVNAIDAIKWE
jgi:lipoprotein-releasing system permease protein